MPLSKKRTEEEDKFNFQRSAVIAFAKEIAKLNFDFDAFLLARGAIVKRGSEIVPLRYDSPEDQTTYLSKYVRHTPYYSLEAATLEWAWSVPANFWYELQAQAREEVSRIWREMDRLDEKRTGKPYHVRASEMMASLRKGMIGLAAAKSV